jgi:hypothetical protein
MSYVAVKELKMKTLLFSIAFLLTTSIALVTIGKADQSDEYRAVQNIAPYLPGNLTAGQALEKSTVYGLDPWEKNQLKNIRASKTVSKGIMSQRAKNAPPAAPTAGGPEFPTQQTGTAPDGTPLRNHYTQNP